MSILISTTLSDAAFFAGETFSCSITFTNTSTPSGIGTRSPGLRRSVSIDHTRRAPRQSTPRRQFVVGPNSISHKDTNGNGTLNGHGPAHDIDDPEGLGNLPSKFGQLGRRKKPNSRSLSIVTGGKVVLNGIDEEDATPPIQSGSSAGSPYSHARRTISLSAAGTPRGGILQDRLTTPMTGTFPGGPSSASPKQYNFWTPFGRRSSSAGQMSTSQEGFRSPPLSAPSSSISDGMEKLSAKQNEDMNNAFSVDLDTVEGTPRSSVDFYMGRNDSMESVVSNIGGSDLRFGHTRRLSSIARNASTVHLAQQRHETLLWSFAQVVGNFTVDESLVKRREFDSLKSKVMYGSAGAGGPGGAVGGGSLGFIGVGGGLFNSGFFGTSNSQSSLADMQHRSDAKSVPVYSTPPSILFVDLHLGPGESKTYIYQLKLPNDIPPSHRGKAIKFTYNLIIGTHRAGSSQQSRIIQLPFRVFNHVAENGLRPMYDLMNPVILYKDEAMTETIADAKKTPNLLHPGATKNSFESYIKDLLKRDGAEPISPTATKFPIVNTPRKNSLLSPEERDHSCKHAIEEVSRRSQKTFFDIKRNGLRVAQVVLIKSNYKLGESVIGVIHFDNNILPVYRMSVTLESQEVIEPSIAYKSSAASAKLTKKQYGGHHESVVNTMRTSFNLTIPPSASPEFTTTGVSLQWGVHFEFAISQAGISRMREQTMVVLSQDDRLANYHAVPTLQAETFECKIGIKVYPNNMESSRALTPTLNFLA